MKRIPPVLATLLISTAALAQGNSGTPVSQPPLKVATIRVGDLFDKWTKVIEFTDALNEEKKKNEEELAKLEKEIKEKVEMRNTPGIGETLKFNLQVEIIQLQAKAKYIMEFWNAQVKERLDQGIAKFFDEIAEEVAAYAKAHGFTMVVKMESGKISEEKDGIDARIARRAILWADPGFDITADVLKSLNEKWEKEKAAMKSNPGGRK